MEWGKFRVVLPFGVGRAEFEALDNGRDLSPVSALLLADNGYGPSNPVEWIHNLYPEIVLLSVSGTDGRRIPSLEVLAAVEGCTLLRTDQNGWIKLSIDGERMRVEVEEIMQGDALYSISDRQDEMIGWR